MNKKFIDKLIDEMKKIGAEVVYITPGEVLEFLVGHSPYMCERFQGLFIKDTKEMFYISNAISSEEMINTFKDEVKVYSWFDGDGFIPVLKKAFEDYGIKDQKIYLSSESRAVDFIDIMDNTDIKVAHGKELLENIRIIKSEEEAEYMSKAGSLADEAFNELIKYIKPGMYEGDINDKLNEIYYKMGVEPSFNSIIASGRNSSMPHYNSYDRKIESKDIIILDFGCKYKGLCSDMTRTVFIGDITEEEKKVYDIVLSANLAGENACKPGVTAKDVDKVARDIIEDEGYGNYFLTRLGHGIGYSVHEAPDIKGTNNTVLSPGMTFSIEPGIYLKDKFGIRIEDIVLVTSEGKEILNKSSKDIIIL